ncbi:MAG TPA: DUF3685 domain-containing protein [Leptolyngbyaceae cyanobacterium]
MSDLVPPRPALPESPLKIVLVNDDPIYCLGLRGVLEPFPDIEVVAEANNSAGIGDILQMGNLDVDLVVLDLDLGRSAGRETTALELCQQFKSLYPHLSILLLVSWLDPVRLAAARQIGVEGYCRKGTAVSQLVDAIRQVGAGEFVWDLESVVRSSEFQLQRSQSETQAGLLPTWLNNIRLSGLRQIEAALVEVDRELQNSRLSVLDRAIVAGRQRELKAARGLVKKLLGETAIASVPARIEEPSLFPSLNLPPRGQTAREQPYSQLRSTPVRGEGELTEASWRSQLFDNTFAHLQYSLQNLTNVPLEIDIFREEKKRELLSLVLRKLEGVFDDLRFSEVQPEQLAEKRSVILLDLWQSATTDFFGRYYTLKVGEQQLEIVNILLKDAPFAQADVLDKIPLVVDLFAHLLFEVPLTIDNALYQAGSTEAIARSELLLQNLIIQVSNGIVQPLLNHFADVEIIKQNFYDRQLISTREIERFRNNLSWKYRLERYVEEPTAMFESRYVLFILNGSGIRKVSIYASRSSELEKLSGMRLAVTLALEARDAVSPRLRALVAFVGSGVVYVLTQVIGRGIGLIGRGVLEGIGNSLQESRVGRNGGRK